MKQGDNEEEPLCPHPNESKHCPKPFNFDSFPLPVAESLIEHLRYHELQNLRDAVNSPAWDNYLNYADTVYNKEIRKYDSFIWTRHFDRVTREHMAPRDGQSVVYLNEAGAMFIFGGRSVSGSNYGPDAPAFNDLWRMDLATRNMHRILVRSTPYPLPKYGASMITYKGELVLFGGRLPSPPSNGGPPRMLANPNTNEIHIFNVESSCWRKLTTLNEAPALSCHSAVICDDLMITFGGISGHRMLNTTFRVLNMKTLHWFVPNIPDVPAAFNLDGQVRVVPNFPIFGEGTTSLIKLKSGHLLLLGELQVPPSSQNLGVVISYDINDPEGSVWNWKKIPVSGKWFFESSGVFGEGSARSRNSNYPAVVPLYTTNGIRLVTLGLPEVYFKSVNSFRCSPDLELRKLRLKNFVENAVKHAKMDIEKGYCSTAEVSEDFLYCEDGLRCRVKDLVVPMRKRHSQLQMRIEMEVDQQYVCPERDLQLDEVDIAYIGECVKMLVTKWKDYFKGMCEGMGTHFHPNPAVASRNLWAEGNLVAFTAFIQLGDDWTPEKLEEIKYVESDCHRHAPPPFKNFSLCAGRAEVLLHGGEKTLKSHSTVTYVMTPASRLPPNRPKIEIPLRYRKCS